MEAVNEISLSGLSDKEQGLIILALSEAVHAYTFSLPKLPYLIGEDVHKELTEKADEMLALRGRLLAHLGNQSRNKE